jgi:putative transposase
MPRTARAAEGGIVYHILNRGNDRRAIFRKDGDYAAFIDLLVEAKEHAEIELFAYCLMPNHWHLALRPKGPRDMAKYLSWVTNTHVKRYRAHYKNSSGHLYQGRYKSFPVETDEYLLTLLRYVEANAVRPTMVRSVQDWPWTSATRRPAGLLSAWPVERPRNWIALLNEKMPERDRSLIQTSIMRDRPYGADNWVKKMAARMNLEFTLRARGRPRKREMAEEK